MKIAARISLGVVTAMLVALVLPRPAGRMFTPDASAQVVPTPTIPDILPGVTPSPTSDPGGGDEGDDEDEGSKGDDGSTDGDGSKGGDSGSNGGKTGGKSGGKKGSKNAGSDDPLGLPPVTAYNRIDGAYNTDRLMAVSARLLALGWSRNDVMSRVFAPFIIGGRSNWIDTWGYPRYGPGPIVRTHEGQDVFCEYGEPVLASQKGIIEYDEGGLGGRIARLHTADGSYWYYAHLSAWNSNLPSGSRVSPGDVIGFCGNTGNALTTPPHVHFGWYSAQGSKNPMRPLIGWLRKAERGASDVLVAATRKRVQRSVLFATARRFGDSFAPGNEAFGIAGGLLASKNRAETPTAQAQVALLSAIARESLGLGQGVVTADTPGAKVKGKGKGKLGDAIGGPGLISRETGD